MVKMAEQVTNWKALGVLHCTRCNLKTSDAGLFHAHNCRPVVQQRNRASLTYRPRIESYFCSLCNTDVPEKEIAEHLENHVSLKPYKCKHCQVACDLQTKFLHKCKGPKKEFQLIISNKTKDLILKARQNQDQMEFYLPLNVTVKGHLLTNSNSRSSAITTQLQNAPLNLKVSRTLQHVHSNLVLDTSPQFSKVQYLLARPMETTPPPSTVPPSFSFVPLISPLRTHMNNNVYSFPSHVTSSAQGHLLAHSTVNNHPSPALTRSSEIFSWHRPAGCAQDEIPGNQEESLIPDSEPLTSCVTIKKLMQEDTYQEPPNDIASSAANVNNKRKENQSEPTERDVSALTSLNEKSKDIKKEDYSYLCVIKGYYLCLQCMNKWWDCHSFFMHIWHHHIHTNDLLTCCPQGYSLNCKHLITALRSVYSNFQYPVPDILKNLFQTSPEKKNESDSVDETSGQNGKNDLVESNGQELVGTTGQNRSNDLVETTGQSKSNNLVETSGQNNTIISTSTSSTRATRTSIDRTDRCSTDSLEYLDSETKSPEIKSYYQCGFQKCNYASMRPVDFLHHIEEAHGSETSFSCNYCGYVGASSSILLDHLGEHIGNEDALVFSGSIISDNEEYSYQSKDIHSIIGKFEEQLKNQKATFTILCKICQTEFFTLLEFREHLISSLLKVISCKNCRSYFLDAGSWQKHRVKEHPNEPRLYCINRKLLCDALKLYNQGVPLYKQNFKSKNTSGDQTVFPTTIQTDNESHKETASKQTSSTDIRLSISPTANEQTSSTDIGLTSSPTANKQTSSTDIGLTSSPTANEQISFPAAIMENFESQSNEQLDHTGNSLNCSDEADSTTKKDDLVTSHPTISPTLPLENNSNGPNCNTPDILEKSCEMEKLKDICGKQQTDEFLKSFYESTGVNKFSCKKCNRKVFSLKRIHAHLFNCIGKMGVAYCPYCYYQGEHSKLLVQHIEKEHPDQNKNLVISLNVNTVEFMKALKLSSLSAQTLADTCAEFKSIEAYRKIKQLRSTTENLTDLLNMRVFSEGSEPVVDSTTCEMATPFSDARRENRQTPMASVIKDDVKEESKFTKQDELTRSSTKEDIQSEKQSKIKIPTKRKCNFTDDYVCENILRPGLSELPMSLVDSTISENECGVPASPLFSTQAKTPTKRKLNSSESHHRTSSFSKISCSSDSRSSHCKSTVPDVMNIAHTKEHGVKRTGLKAGIKHVALQRYQCSRCDYICKGNESSMAEHLRTSHPYKACGYCGAVYFTKVELEKHCQFVHTGKKYCTSDEISVKDFFTLVSMKPNLKRKKKEENFNGDKKDNLENKNKNSSNGQVPPTADKTNVQPNSTVALSAHHDSQTPERLTTPDANIKKADSSIFPFKCSVCSSYQKCIAGIVDHFRWLHANRVVEFMDRKYRTLYTLQENTLTCKPGSAVPSSKHFCYFCSYHHQKRPEVEAHIAADHSGYQIKVLSLDLPEEQVDTKEDYSSDADIGNVLKTRSNITIAAKPKPVTNYNCPRCDQLCTSLFAFRLHLAMKHEGFRPIKSSMAIAGLPMCHVCGYIGNSQKDLGAHMAWHCQERQFICSQCTFDSHKKNGVLVHIKMFHVDDPNAKVINRSLQANLPRPVLVDLDPVVALRNCLSCENADYLRNLLVKHDIKLLDVEGEDICETILENQNKNKQYFDVRTIKNS